MFHASPACTTLDLRSFEIRMALIFKANLMQPKMVLGFEVSYKNLQKFLGNLQK